MWLSKKQMLVLGVGLLVGCGGGMRGTGSRLTDGGLEEQLKIRQPQSQPFSFSLFGAAEELCKINTLDNEVQIVVDTELGRAKRMPEGCGFYLPTQATSIKVVVVSRRNVSGSYEITKFQCGNSDGKVLTKELLLGRNTVIPIPALKDPVQSYLELVLRLSDSESLTQRIKLSNEKFNNCN